MRPRVLLADDESSVRLALRKIIEEQGCDVTPVSDGAQALEALAKGGYQLVVTDLRMPQADGMQVVRAATERDPPVPVVVLTGYGTVQRAVEAMRLGAANFLTKPFEIPDVENVIREVLSLGPPKEGPGHAPRRPDEPRAHALVGTSAPTMRIRALVAQIANADVTVLLTGESGTGKEVVAHLIHDSSTRHRGPFIPVNCAAIPEPLLESELFGHARGSFTGATQARTGRFAQAAGGALFLDEIAEMSPGLQAKVLRVLQDKEVVPVGSNHSHRVDVRIIAATNRNLAEMVDSGRFRDDLYYRLNVIPIHLPPLRERPEDIPALCQHFLNRSCTRRGKAQVELSSVISASALQRLKDYTWPGNVRELDNLIERVLILRSEGEVFGAADLPLLSTGSMGSHALGAGGAGGLGRELYLGERRPSNVPRSRGVVQTVQTLAGMPSLPPLQSSGVDLQQELNRHEQVRIHEALELCGGNRARAAELLGMNRTTLVEKLKRMRRPAEERQESRAGGSAEARAASAEAGAASTEARAATSAEAGAASAEARAASAEAGAASTEARAATSAEAGAASAEAEATSTEAGAVSTEAGAASAEAGATSAEACAGTSAEAGAARAEAGATSTEARAGTSAEAGAGSTEARAGTSAEAGVGSTDAGAGTSAESGAAANTEVGSGAGPGGARRDEVPDRGLGFPKSRLD